MCAMRRECKNSTWELTRLPSLTLGRDSRSRASRMATPAIRRANRTDAATMRCADDTRETCNNTALNDVRAIYERAVAVMVAADADARPTATRLLYHLNLEASGVPPVSEANNVLNVLRAATADAGSPFAHALPASNAAGARSLLATFVGILQKRACHEAELIAEAGASSPVLTPAAAPGALGGGGPVPSLMHLPPITLSNAEDKKNLRISEAGAYLEKHVPALQQIAPSLIPHKDAILLFDPWTTAAAMPKLPLWKDMSKKLHMQDVVVGRESGVADLICALVAMLNAYAGPLPDGYTASVTDTTVLTYQKRTVDPSTGAATMASETRPPCLAAYAVNQAIATIYATAEPLTIEQKNEYAQAFWTCLSTRMTEQVKKSLTRALLAALDHRDLQPWLSKPRVAEEAAAPATAQAGRHRNERVRERDPNDRDDRSRSGERRSQRRDEKAQRPICEQYRRDGKCKAHADKKCKDKRHPDAWKNIGEEAYNEGT